MAEKIWQNMRSRQCDKANAKVTLQAEIIFPSEHLPDTPPRVGMHRCSHGQFCMRQQHGACKWSGGNPNFDPFTEKDL